MDSVDVKNIFQIVTRRVFNQTDREDIAQDACVIMLLRQTNPWCAVIDAARSFYGSRHPNSMRGRVYAVGDMGELASVYPTTAQLWDRWLDEETEDQFDEWRRLPAAERYSRRVESLTALGCSL